MKLLRAKVKFGPLIVGPLPRVVGTLSALPKKFTAAPSDIIELRLDKMAKPADWLERCRAMEAAGFPVLLTIRLRAEGGQWNAPDESRLELFQQALRFLAGVDIELNSPLAPIVARLAKKLNKACVISFHDFKKTPPLAELKAIVTRAQKLGSIVKISTMINQPKDIATLRALLGMKWKRPLCVIGMGADVAHTRVEFPAHGSCLTYSYLDKSAAPGQLSATALVRRLRKMHPSYDKDYARRFHRSLAASSMQRATSAVQPV